MIHPRVLAVTVLALVLAASASAQSSFSSSANPYRSASGLGGGLHFSSPAAAYMNTMFMRGSDKAQVEAVKRESAARRARQAGTAVAPAATHFTLMPEEQAAVLDSLVQGVAAGRPREQMRARLANLSEMVERTPGWQKGNLANATCTLAALSYTKASGRELDPALVHELVLGVDEVCAKDPAFKAMDARQRSRVYYLFTATIGITLQLCLSKDPAEAAQGRALAANNLHELGIRI